MLPHLEEADKVLEVMAAEGLRRGEHGLQVYVMAGIPADILLAQDFAETAPPLSSSTSPPPRRAATGRTEWSL
ncbi:hypothetical protein K7B10_06765 [Streptomyces flavotricini]|uniref:Uncharacterized protein n=1 Tax=Streptomyces flavotricini TaxID=66888 RepID=A0ABS8E0L1_9ACTN|nr:hypothetical protein [Streptomyces flavotricini]MCC0094493.1 hypothetical protein [Streptomyces flavotricini]